MTDDQWTGHVEAIRALMQVLEAILTKLSEAAARRNEKDAIKRITEAAKLIDRATDRLALPF